MTTRKINNAQTLEAQPNMLICVGSMIVRAAMGDHRAHFRQQWCALRILNTDAKPPCKTAHLFALRMIIAATSNDVMAAGIYGALNIFKATLLQPQLDFVP